MHELFYTSVEHWAVLATDSPADVNYSMGPHQQKPQLTGADWCWHASLCNRSFSNSAADAGYSMMSWCLMSSDVIWHIRDKLWPMPKHGSIKATYVRCMRVSVAVTCHLHFWQNDRDFLRATVVTRGWNGYRNKSQHRKSGEENSPAVPAGIRTRDLSITSPAL